MAEHINEITNYFSNLIDQLDQNKPHIKHSIDDLFIKDQVIYYKLFAIINGYTVINNHIISLNWEEIVKINCVKLFCDYKNKHELRAVDVIVAGDYPKLLFKILFKESFVNLDKYHNLVVQYQRTKCMDLIQSIDKILENIDNAIEKNKILSHEVLNIIQTKILT
jgi:hypothetical protein